MSRKCIWCNQEKEVEDFPFRCDGSLNKRPYCLDCKRTKDKERYRDLSEEQKQKKNNISKKYRHKIRSEVIKKYGNACSCLGCNEQKLEFLVIDHINGGGTKERKKISCYNFYLRLFKDNLMLDKYRVLCHNCNMSRGLYGYCPHDFFKRI